METKQGVRELPAKWREEADNCDDLAREREAENTRNGQWFRGCANGHRLAAGELEDAMIQSGVTTSRLLGVLRDALEAGDDGDWQSARHVILAALYNHDALCNPA